MNARDSIAYFSKTPLHLEIADEEMVTNFNARWQLQTGEPVPCCKLAFNSLDEVWRWWKEVCVSQMTALASVKALVEIYDSGEDTLRQEVRDWCLCHELKPASLVLIHLTKVLDQVGVPRRWRSYMIQNGIGHRPTERWMRRKVWCEIQTPAMEARVLSRLPTPKAQADVRKRI